MPTILSNKRLFTILGLFTSMALLAPLYFWPNAYAPFSTPTLIGFLFFVELALPAYLILAARKQHPFAVLRKPIVLSLSILVLTLIFTSFTGADPLNSLFGTFQRPVSTIVWIHGWFFVLYIVELLQARIWKKYLTTILVCTATLIAIFTLGEGRLWPTFVGFEGRAASLLGGPNYLAAFLILPTFLSFAAGTRSKRYKPLFYVAGTGMILGIILSATRGAILGLIAAGLILLGFLSLKKINLSKKVITTTASILAAAVIAVVIVRAISPNSVWNRFTNLSDKDIAIRLVYWRWAADGWFENPIFGVGPQNFYVIADKRFNKDMYELTSVWPDKPHNMVLERLATTGLLGTIAWLALVFLLMHKLWKRKDRSSELLIAGLAAYIVQGLFFFDGISDTILFLFIIAFICGHETDHIVQRRFAPIISGFIGIIVLAIGVTLLILPMRAQVLAAGRGKIYNGSIVIDDTLVSKTAFTRASDFETNSLEATNQAIKAHKRTITRHPLRQAAWNDLGQLYFYKATIEGGPVDQEALSVLKRAAELAPGRREAAYIYALILQYNESLKQPK